MTKSAKLKVRIILYTITTLLFLAILIFHLDTLALIIGYLILIPTLIWTSIDTIKGLNK